MQQWPDGTSNKEIKQHLNYFFRYFGGLRIDPIVDIIIVVSMFVFFGIFSNYLYV